MSALRDLPEFDRDPTSPRLVMPGRRVRAGEGAAWIGDGWRLFRPAKLMWVTFLVLLFLGQFALGLIPYAGPMLGSLAMPILLGGVALGCRSLETGGDLDLEHLLAGLRRNTGYLFAIGLLYGLGELALLLVMGAIAGLSIVGAVLSGDAVAIARVVNDLDPIPVAIGALAALALAVPLVAALWFAPALAMLHGIPALPAMGASLGACVRNTLPMLLYGLLMGALLMVAILPVFLGLLVWLPLAIASTYAAYRSIFTEADEVEP